MTWQIHAERDGAFHEWVIGDATQATGRDGSEYAVSHGHERTSVFVPNQMGPGTRDSRESPDRPEPALAPPSLAHVLAFALRRPADSKGAREVRSSDLDGICNPPSAPVRSLAPRAAALLARAAEEGVELTPFGVALSLSWNLVWAARALAVLARRQLIATPPAVAAIPADDDWFVPIVRTGTIADLEDYASRSAAPGPSQQPPTPAREIPDLAAPIRLERLRLRDIGPAPEMDLTLGSRLTVLTGDNGLGKTFALDVIWWALTRTWAGHPAWPRTGTQMAPTIDVLLSGGGEPVRGQYDFSAQAWTAPAQREHPGLAIYARVDGGYSVWDPARNPAGRVGAYHLDPTEVWEGKKNGNGWLTNGLLRDWVTWQLGRTELFAALTEALRSLSEGPPAMEPGKPTRISIADARDIPTIRLPYAEVPLPHVSAGMRRVIALAYVALWAWNEHREAARLAHQEPTSRLVLLMDEVEAHLHPRWQRTLLPAVLGVLGSLADALEVQIVASTHAPLVLASLEPHFDEATDRVIVFEQTPEGVAAREESWAMQGDAVGWLVSGVFGLDQARSKEAEQAIEAAEAFMRGVVELPVGLTSRDQIDAQLRRLLAGHDPFWPRWVVHARSARA